MIYKQLKNRKLQKMINTILIALFIIYFIGMFFYVIKVNRRVILKTDTVSEIIHAKYGGSSRSRSDRYYLQDKDYHLKHYYSLFPPLRIILERNRIKSRNSISYYIDKEEIKKMEERKIKEYTDIGITVGADCPKKAWYWFTLLSYVLKSTNFGVIINALLFFLCLVFYRPITPIGKYFLVFMIIYWITWVLIF